MSVEGGNSGSIRRYLLGEVSEPEREQVERRLMTEDDFYQQLLIAEDELIDEYVADALPEQERAKFSRHFLHVTELRQDVRFAKALSEHARKLAPQVETGVSNAPASVSLLDRLRKFFMQPAIGVAFAVALLAAVVLAAWLFKQNSQLRNQVEQLQARQTPAPAPQTDLQEQLASERLLNEQLSAELQRQQELLAEESRKPQLTQGQRPQPTPASEYGPPSGVSTFVALALTPGSVRDSGKLKKISILPATRAAKVRLDLSAGGYRSYRIILRTVEGREVLARQGLRAVGGKSVSLNIPAKLLSPDDYEILLSGVNASGESEEISSYYFRVLK